MTAAGSPIRPPGSAGLVRLVAVREITARIRDKNFLISSVVILVILLGSIALPALLGSEGEGTRIGVVGDAGELRPALEGQGEALDVDVTVVELDDEAAAREAVEAEEVDGALLAGAGVSELLVRQSAGGPLEAVAGGALTQVAVGRQLAEAGITELAVPELEVTALDPDADEDGQRVLLAMIGTAALYGLLVLFGQFVAQGVVEEKSSRVVELLLATMRPWHLLAGKIIGLGLLGLGQIVLVAVVGVGGALAFDLVDIPGELVGTAVTVVLWFVVGYAFYATIFAVAASLVSRQEDLNSVLTPTILLLVAAVVVGIQASAAPDGTLALVTSYVPGVSPLVMPVRQAAGHVAAWEVGLSVLGMVAATALLLWFGGRVYAGALLRTSGKTRIREALEAERA